MDTKERIIDLLKRTKREGIDKMITYLQESDFFEAPASTKFHGSYAGGLAKHSLRVYELLLGWTEPLKLSEASGAGQKPLPLNVGNIIIAALLHDICKNGAYIGTEKPYKWNKGQPKGHALLSIKRIKKYIALEPIEEMMITYHMGVYGLNEFYAKGDWQTGEYPIGEIEQVLKDCFPGPEYPIRGDHAKDKSMSREESKKARYGKSMANAWYHNPICKVMYFCDEIATLEEKASEV